MDRVRGLVLEALVMVAVAVVTVEQVVLVPMELLVVQHMDRALHRSHMALVVERETFMMVELVAELSNLWPRQA
jgi:hypothetical protein